MTTPQSDGTLQTDLVPLFESKITTESELTTKLSNLFKNEPDFESLFNRVKRVPDTI